MGTFGATRNPRSLADDFRLRSDLQLEELFLQRNDLLHPIPNDISELATRATSVESVTCAIDSLSKVELVVCEVLAALPDGISSTELHQTLRNSEGYGQQEIDLALLHLWSVGLLWGTSHIMHLIRTAREFFGPYPCKLGPALADTRVDIRQFSEDPSNLDALLRTAPVDANKIVQEMAWTNPRGSYPNAYKRITPKTASGPVEWLLAHNVLIAVDENSVILPREIALHIRDQQFVRGIECAEPKYADQTFAITDVNATGVLKALEFIQNFEQVLNQIAKTPVSPLRTGGISAKDFVELSSLSGVSELCLAVVLDTAFVGRLISADEKLGWMPSSLFDVWLEQTDEDRWSHLATIWRDMKRSPHQVVKGTKNSLHPTENMAASQLRKTVLMALSMLETGQSFKKSELFNFLQWKQPRLFTAEAVVDIDATLDEMEILGITSMNTVTEFGKKIAQGGEGAADLKNNLPECIDHIIVQTDLTALAPGRLIQEQRRFMQQIAIIESTSVATVYRFTPGSILNGIESGLSAGDIINELTKLSRTPIPQPLTYLAQDVERRHGQLKIGTASVYLKCDDDQLMTTMLADRALAVLELHKISPQVLVSTQSSEIVLARLRNAGYAPSIDNRNGMSTITTAQVHRTTPHSTPLAQPLALSTRLVSATVRAMRAVEEPKPKLTVNSPSSSQATSTGETLAILKQSLENNTQVWIGYVDKAGQTTEHFIEPLTFSAGSLTAFDVQSHQVRTFTVSRIASAELVTNELVPESQDAAT